MPTYDLGTILIMVRKVPATTVSIIRLIATIVTLGGFKCYPVFFVGAPWTSFSPQDSKMATELHQFSLAGFSEILPTIMGLVGFRRKAMGKKCVSVSICWFR